MIPARAARPIVYAVLLAGFLASGLGAAEKKNDRGRAGFAQLKLTLIAAFC
jgi:hypothetical protein